MGAYVMKVRCERYTAPWRDGRKNPKRARLGCESDPRPSAGACPGRTGRLTAALNKKPRNFGTGNPGNAMDCIRRLRGLPREVSLRNDIVGGIGYGHGDLAGDALGPGVRAYGEERRQPDRNRAKVCHGSMEGSIYGGGT